MGSYIIEYTIAGVGQATLVLGDSAESALEAFANAQKIHNDTTGLVKIEGAKVASFHSGDEIIYPSSMVSYSLFCGKKIYAARDVFRKEEL